MHTTQAVDVGRDLVKKLVTDDVVKIALIKDSTLLGAIGTVSHMGVYVYYVQLHGFGFSARWDS